MSENSSWYRSQWTVGLWGNTYPSTYVPHGSLGSCIMDPKPFHKLLSTLPDYSSVEEFIGHAVQDDGTSGGPELSYSGYVGFGVMQGLGARLAMFNRHGWQKRVVHHPPHWYSPLCIEAFNLWRLMHKRYKPRACRPIDDVPMSRLVRRKRSHLGACTYNVGSTHQRACQMAQDLWDLIKQFQHIVWSHNFYRRRFAPSPHSPNRSLNRTAMALLQLQLLCSDLDIFPGYPKLDALKQRLPVVARRLRDSFLGLCDATKTLLQGPIVAKDICAPLDCRRTSVRGLQWKPFFLTDLTTGSQPDLVALVHLLVKVQQQSNKVLPILVDENIHYHPCKMIYSKLYAQYNLALFLNQCPVLYGVWQDPEAALEAVRQAVGGGCRSGWGRLLSVTNAMEASIWRQGDSGWA